MKKESVAYCVDRKGFFIDWVSCRIIGKRVLLKMGSISLEKNKNEN